MENNLNSKKKLYYICHYCKTYISHRRKDMINHFNRKIKCCCNSLFSYDECKVLSLNKKYYIYKGGIYILPFFVI